MRWSIIHLASHIMSDFAAIISPCLITASAPGKRHRSKLPARISGASCTCSLWNGEIVPSSSGRDPFRVIDGRGQTRTHTTGVERGQTEFGYRSLDVLQGPLFVSFCSCSYVPDLSSRSSNNTLLKMLSMKPILRFWIRVFSILLKGEKKNRIAGSSHSSIMSIKYQ